MSLFAVALTGAVVPVFVFLAASPRVKAPDTKISKEIVISENDNNSGPEFYLNRAMNYKSAIQCAREKKIEAMLLRGMEKDLVKARNMLRTGEHRLSGLMLDMIQKEIKWAHGMQQQIKERTLP